MKDYLKKAIELAGGQTALALKLSNEIGIPEKIKQAHIWSWANESKNGAPPQYCPLIEKILRGKITKEQLRPDVFRARA